MKQKMSKGVFKKWAHQNKERLVLRFQLEQMPGKHLVELAEERDYEPEPKDTREKIVKVIMGDLWVELPHGYNRRKVCRALGIGTNLRAREVGPLGRQMHIRMPSL